MPEEIYVSTDIEADGPIPGPHSMLSLASVALRADKSVVDEFAVNLSTLPGAAPHPRTVLWWEGHKEAFQKTRENVEDPETAIPRYAKWVQGLPGRVVLVGQPVAFDFMWVYWYLQRFTGGSVFGHSALDIKSYAMAVLKRPYRECVLDAMPVQWRDDLPYTHVAIDDARAQGAIFCNMIRANGASDA